jgi:hypothetical protein
VTQFEIWPDLAEDQRYSHEEINEIADQCRSAWGLGLGPISNVLSLLESKPYLRVSCAIIQQSLSVLVERVHGVSGDCQDGILELCNPGFRYVLDADNGFRKRFGNADQ